MAMLIVLSRRSCCVFSSLLRLGWEEEMCSGRGMVCGWLVVGKTESKVETFV